MVLLEFSIFLLRLSFCFKDIHNCWSISWIAALKFMSDDSNISVILAVSSVVTFYSSVLGLPGSWYDEWFSFETWIFWVSYFETPDLGWLLCQKNYAHIIIVGQVLNCGFLYIRQQSIVWCETQSLFSRNAPLILNDNGFFFSNLNSISIFLALFYIIILLHFGIKWQSSTEYKSTTSLGQIKTWNC